MADRSLSRKTQMLHFLLTFQSQSRDHHHQNQMESNIMLEKRYFFIVTSQRKQITHIANR